MNALSRCRVPLRPSGSSKPNLRLVKPVADPAIEALEVKRGIAETIALEKGRGEIFVGHTPYERLDPLARLLAAGEITRAQKIAGDKYGGLYRYLYDQRKQSGHWKTFFETKIDDAIKINRLRLDGIGGHADQIFLCDQICGRGIRPDQLWGSKWAPLVIEHLGTALTSLALYYGLIWKDDGLDR